ncbi:hypothetical protein CDAR_394171 [Caerostris darwini]|uniref:Uncharacterized protein n=1 Tax=Caerostris darwini TaxID=1538125 RepID=A0AAV4RJP6_9ARAC|nr:hypothetical protein CDAR_394171 [Caerostris darwini]
MHGYLIRASTIAKELGYGRPESRVAARVALAVGELCGGGSTSPSRALSRGSGRSLRLEVAFISVLPQTIPRSSTPFETMQYGTR